MNKNFLRRMGDLISRAISILFRNTNAAKQNDGDMVVLETGKRGNTTVSGSMRNGMKEGLWKYFDATGRLVMEEHYKNGKLDGTFRSYYINGRLFGLGNYSEDRRHGEFLIFKEDGRLQETRIYQHGELLQVHTENGKQDKDYYWPA